MTVARPAPIMVMIAQGVLFGTKRSPEYLAARSDLMPDSDAYPLLGWEREQSEMEYQTNRSLLMKHMPAQVLHTVDMIGWLNEKAGADPNTADAVLGAWVGVLHTEMLRRVVLDPGTLRRLEEGHEVLVLNEELAPRRRCLGPGNWTTEQLWMRISAQTTLMHREVSLLLRLIAQKFRELNGELAFEPIGWVIVTSSNEFEAHLWDDFFEPSEERTIEPAKLTYVRGQTFRPR